MEYSYYFYETELGDLTLVSNGDALVTVHFGKGTLKGCYFGEDEILMEAIMEINQFIAGQRKKFDLPLDPMGNEFEKKVCRYVLENIPYGSLKTYEAIAKALEATPEAVEEALTTNSCPLVIPCHRVVGADKKIHGYVGGAKIKAGLIKFENAHKNVEFVVPDYEEESSGEDVFPALF